MRNKTFRLNSLQILVLIPLIFLMSCASENNSLSQEPGGDISTQIPTDGEITVNVNEKHQTVHGFGASGAWWAQDVGGWEHEVRDHIIQLLFDQQEGIGLSIYRYNIGGGDGESIPDKWRRAETFEIAQGEYDWSRDTNAIWVLKAAHAAGVEHFVAFAVSPPARMTISGRTNADAENQSNLPPEMYAQFAQYLVDVTRHLQEDEGIPIGWLSPINEPQWDWLMQSGQEGCHYEPKEVAAMTKALIRAIQENKLNVKISVFEAGEWWNSTQDYIDPLLGDPEIAPYLDHLSIHSYWSNTQDKERLIAYLDKNYPNTSVEMTEWTEMEQGRDVYMDSALVLANIIHEDLTIGRVESWQYWIAVSKYNFHDGLIYVALNDHEITETKRLWTMGNYSRYIRPGFQRIEAKSSLDQVKTTVFQSPDEDQFILVVINNDETKQTLRVNGVPSEYGQVAVYETSKENNLKEIFSGSLPSVFSFSSESVTTLVYQK